jgi:serine/threonine protein kinase
MHHPNVLRCFEVFTSNRNCYIITELCNEGDLESKFRHRQRMEEPTVRNIVTDIYKGLQYIAGKNIIHRDLKISNIFMHNGVAKIADFGFALHCTYVTHKAAKTSKI